VTLTPDGNGGHRVTFAPRTWLAFAAVSLSAALLAGSLLLGGVKLYVRAELAEHTVKPHPSTEQRLNKLETD